MPETTFTFRVDEDLKNSFTSVAKAHDRPGSQLLRDFMRDYVAKAEHDAWFRAKVQEALDDPRPAIPHEQVEAHFAKRRAAALLKEQR